MTALSENRNTKEREARLRKYTVKDAEKMYAGGMAALNTSTGEVEMASDSANLTVVGCVEKYVDNTDDGEKVTVKNGCFLFNNSSGNPVTNANVGTRCYVEDDNTVSSAQGDNAVVAGTVFEVTSDGVWVDIAPYLPPSS
jgi:hypothetical protein